ncbi:uncharacterized protein LOC142341481 isoform X2 [Convolutriloba macropyga]
MNILFRNSRHISHISNNQIVKQLGFKSTAPRIAGAFYSAQQTIQLDKFKLNDNLASPFNEKTIIDPKYINQRISIVLCDHITMEKWREIKICGLQNDQSVFYVDLFNKKTKFENGFVFSGIDCMSVLLIVDLSGPQKLNISQGAFLLALKRAIASCAQRSINEFVVLTSPENFTDVDNFLKREQQQKTAMFEMLSNGWRVQKHASDLQIQNYAPYVGDRKFNSKLHYQKNRKILLDSLSKTCNIIKIRHLLLATRLDFFQKLTTEEYKKLVGDGNRYDTYTEVMKVIGAGAMSERTPGKDLIRAGYSAVHSKDPRAIRLAINFSKQNLILGEEFHYFFKKHGQQSKDQTMSFLTLLCMHPKSEVDATEALLEADWPRKFLASRYRRRNAFEWSCR